jgi:branched-chain amino acid transport system permease protein
VLIAYIAVVLGGLGDMVGALLAALIVAAVEVIGSYTIGTGWKEVLYLLLFLGILVVRPAGIFGQRGAESLGM